MNFENSIILLVVLLIAAAPLWFLWKGRMLEQHQRQREDAARHAGAPSLTKPTSKAGTPQ